jgi:protein involved in polysaccharide export with SLBB domain
MSLFRKWIPAIGALGLCISFLACQTVQPAKTPLEMASGPQPRLSLGPGDVLDIKFFYASELNESQTVRPDGKITLQLIGDVDVKGKTPEELKKELSQAYTGQLRIPEVAVIVRSIFNRKIYVGGDVNRPGAIEMPAPITALEAIMQAGGFDYRRAEVSNVVIIRHKDGKRYGCALDFTPALKGMEFQQFYLEPQDIVYVPRTKISQVNLWIDQYINQIVPRVGFGITWPVGTGGTIAIVPPTTVVTQP